MDALFAIANRFIALDRQVNVMLRAILSNADLQQRILDLNRLGQLYEKGVDKHGTSLEVHGGRYTDKTISIKSGKGQRVDHVTLKDTGEFYASFTLYVGDSYFEIDANTIKEGRDYSGDKYGDDLTTRWGEGILGLTQESKDELSEWITGPLTDAVKRYLTS